MDSSNAGTSTFQSCFYFFVWVYGVIYSAYQLQLSSNYFDNYYDAYNDFDSGWSWIRKKRDNADQEWRVWLSLVNKLIPFTIVHLLASHIIKINNFGNTLLCCWYIWSSAFFIYTHLGISAVLCVILQPSIIHLSTSTCSKSVAWLIHVSWLFVIHVLKSPDGTFQSLLGFNDEQYYILTLMMCWTHLRSISHNMDSIDDKCSSNFLEKLAYCLYLPTLFFGPLILYHEFQESINRSYQRGYYEKVQTFIVKLIRYTFWQYVTEFLLHFIYVNAIQYHPQVVKNLNPWAFYGLGYCMGQFFLNKYVVIYGTCSSLCNLDDVKAPPQPKCIARIHLYSDMWKHFDRGLYNFLIKYIYVPTQKSNRCCGKLFASFLCFTFIFIWHGIQMNIFIWASLNFIGIAFESLTISITRSKPYQKLQTFLTPNDIRRIYCTWTAAFLGMSAISNFYFFGGEEIGNIFVQRIADDSLGTFLLLVFFLYSCCQVSTDIKNWEKRSNMK